MSLPCGINQIFQAFLCDFRVILRGAGEGPFWLQSRIVSQSSLHRFVRSRESLDVLVAENLNLEQHVDNMFESEYHVGCCCLPSVTVSSAQLSCMDDYLARARAMHMIDQYDCVHHLWSCEAPRFRRTGHVVFRPSAEARSFCDSIVPDQRARASNASVVPSYPHERFGLFAPTPACYANFGWRNGRRLSGWMRLDWESPALLLVDSARRTCRSLSSKACPRTSSRRPRLQRRCEAG